MHLGLAEPTSYHSFLRVFTSVGRGRLAFASCKNARAFVPFVFVQAEGVLWSGSVIDVIHINTRNKRNALAGRASWLVERVGWSSKLAGRASWLVEHWRRAATLF